MGDLALALAGMSRVGPNRNGKEKPPKKRSRIVGVGVDDNLD